MTKANRKSSGPLGLVVPLVLALGPPLMVATAVDRWGLDIPVNDEWDAIPMLVKAREGTLDFAHIWAQHNEHRHVIPRLLILALARLSDWNIRWELAANVVIAAATLIVHVLLMRRTFGHALAIGPTLPRWLAVVASTLLFSMTQHENWRSGWMISAFLIMFIVAASALALTYSGRHGMIAMAAAGIAGPLCFGNGVLLSFILAAGVFLLPVHGSRRERLKKSAVLAGIGVVMAVVYGIGLRRLAYHPSPIAALHAPVAYIHYVLAYAGAPLSRDVQGATICGLLGLLAFGASVVWLHRRSPEYRAVLVPWGVVASFAISSAMLTGIGRVGMGVDQALASRYVTMTVPFWITTCIFVALVLVEHQRDTAFSRSRLAALTALMATLGVLGAASFVRASVDDADGFRAWSEINGAARECVLGWRLAPDDCLFALMPIDRGGGIVRARSRALETLGLGPFRRAAKLPSIVAYTLIDSAPAGYLDVVEILPHDGRVAVSGWAMDPAKHVPIESVLVAVDGETLGFAVMGRTRADLVAIDPRLGQAGWHFIFHAFRLTRGPHLFTAYALLGEGRAAKLDGSQSFDVRP